MTRQFQYQRGHVSDPIKTRNGLVFKIRYRVPTAGGKWKHRRETLSGLTGKKAARVVLEERIKSVSAHALGQLAAEMMLSEFIAAFWKPLLAQLPNSAERFWPFSGCS